MSKVLRKDKSKYSLILISLLILFFLVFYFSYVRIVRPSDYIFWFMPSKLLVFFFGVLGIFASLLLLYITFRSFLNKEFYIKIDREGLYLGLILYNSKLIHWNNILKIECIKINGIKHLKIDVSNIEMYRKKEKGIIKYFFEKNFKKYKTPYVINISLLSGTFENNFEIIMRSWEKYRKKHPNTEM